MKAVIDMLITAGSVEGCAALVGPEAAARAMHELAKTAPEEIRPSWPMVIQWARLQEAYQVAKELGDVRGMRDAANDSRNLLQSVY